MRAMTPWHGEAGSRAGPRPPLTASPRSHDAGTPGGCWRRRGAGPRRDRRRPATASPRGPPGPSTCAAAAGPVASRRSSGRGSGWPSNTMPNISAVSRSCQAAAGNRSTMLARWRSAPAPGWRRGRAPERVGDDDAGEHLDVVDPVDAGEEVQERCPRSRRPASVRTHSSRATLSRDASGDEVRPATSASGRGGHPGCRPRRGRAGRRPGHRRRIPVGAPGAGARTERDDHRASGAASTDACSTAATTAGARGVGHGAGDQHHRPLGRARRRRVRHEQAQPDRGLDLDGAAGQSQAQRRGPARRASATRYVRGRGGLPSITAHPSPCPRWAIRPRAASDRVPGRSCDGNVMRRISRSPRPSRVV